MRFERTLMTPELAAKLLASNYEGQRKLGQSFVASLAADMRAGAFLDTGDTIKVDVEGKLIDGQHRLAAVVAAQVPLMMTVAYDVDRTVYAVLDQGHKRTFGDYLASLGVKEATQHAAATTFLHSMVRSHRLIGAQAWHVRPTMNVLIERWLAERDILDPYATAAARLGRVMRFSGGYLHAFAAVASVTNTADPDAFLTGAATGASLEDGDSRLALNRALIDRLATPAPKRFAPAYYQSLVVRAWNAYARNDEVRNLRGVDGGKWVEFWDPKDRISERWPLEKDGYNAGGAR
jgi:hypothetical protein